MQSDELCSFGIYLKGKLKELGKTDAWLLKRLRQEGSFMNEETLAAVYNGTNQSRPRQAMIGMIIHAEEERQRLKKVAGIHDERYEV